MTESRVLDHVLSRRFGYGGKLGLWCKDGRLAEGLIKEKFPQGEVLIKAIEVLKDSEEFLGGEVDETELAKLLESRAGGVTLS